MKAVRACHSTNIFNIAFYYNKKPKTIFEVSTAVFMKVPVFYDVTRCWKFGLAYPIYTVSYPRKSKFSKALNLKKKTTINCRALNSKTVCRTCVMASTRGPIRIQILHKKIRQLLLDSSSQSILAVYRLLSVSNLTVFFLAVVLVFLFLLNRGFEY